MSVAFNDVAIWRDQLQSIPDLTDYRALDDAYTLFQNKRKLNHSFVVNVLAQALYELFSADDEDEEDVVMDSAPTPPWKGEDGILLWVLIKWISEVGGVKTIGLGTVGFSSTTALSCRTRSGLDKFENRNEPEPLLPFPVLVREEGGGGG